MIYRFSPADNKQLTDVASLLNSLKQKMPVGERIYL